LTVLSILLEVFGACCISLASSLGYLIFFLQKKFPIYMMHTAMWSDAGGLFLGSAFGKTPFANSISPNKT